jgi:hypothetical protein
MGLTDQQRDLFDAQGFVVLPGLLDEERVAEVSAGVDRYVEAEPRFDGRNVWQYPELGDLIVDATVLGLVDDLMRGAACTFHHMHVARHEAGLKGIGWHHDYEQIPQTNRSHLQVHVLHYLNGLNGTVGDLLLLAGSHRSVMRRDAFALFGTEDLPGTVVLDDLPPGTVVLAHSATVHARRPKPGGEGAPARYFLDIAFMQQGVLWPSYGREGWRDTLRELAARWGSPDRPGLFDEAAFFDIADAVARVQHLEGSMAMLLPEPDAAAARPVGGAIPIVQ